MKNDLAIIIPCYNSEQSIGKCLKSILAQDFHNYDIYVIDDGSQDGTEIEVKSISDKRIHYYSQSNAGVSAARNKGIELSLEHDRIMFVDSDDWLEDNALSVMMEERNCSDYTFCNWNEYKIKNTVLCVEEFKMNKLFAYNVGIDDVRKSLIRSRSGGSPWGKIFKTSLIEKNDIRFIEGLPYAEDYLFNLTYLQYAKTVKYIDKPLYAYDCTHIGARAKFRKDIVDILKKVEDVKYSLQYSGGGISESLMLN